MIVENVTKLTVNLKSREIYTDKICKEDKTMKFFKEKKRFEKI